MSESQPTIHKRPSALTSKNSVLMLGWLSIILLIISIPSSYAITSINAGKLTTRTTQTESDKIGVQLSQQCITALKNHVKTDCPTYQVLDPQDNTNHEYYGKLVNDSNGFFHRGKALAPDYYNVIKEKGWIVAVDPTEQFIEGIKTKMIIIVPPGTLNGYINPDESVGNNHTRIEYHDRYVDRTCTEARIAYSESLYKDTIAYLESGCKTTNYITSEKKQTGNKSVTFDNPYSTLHLQSLISKIKATGGLKDCIHTQCNYTDPYKKVGYK